MTGLVVFVLAAPFALATIVYVLAAPDDRTANRPHRIASNDEWAWAIPRGIAAAALVMAALVVLLLVAPR